MECMPLVGWRGSPKDLNIIAKGFGFRRYSVGDADSGAEPDPGRATTAI